MYNIVRGIISIIIGVVFCVMQATGKFGTSRSSGYLFGVLIIVFGGYRLYRGLIQR